MENKTEYGVPADTIKALRTNAKLSYRAMAAACQEAIDPTAIHKIEHGGGYTKNSLEILAKALNTTVDAFFIPPEILAYNQLPKDTQDRIKHTIQDAAAVYFLSNKQK